MEVEAIFIRIISWNLNGLLSSVEQRAFDALAPLSPDVLCLQEIRTFKEPEILSGYSHFWNHAERKGYAGTAILSRVEPVAVSNGLGTFFQDRDGRVMTVELSGFFLVNVYVPNSQRNLRRQSYRVQWDEGFLAYIDDLRKRKPVIICGDFNVTRSELDYYAENMRQFWAAQGFASDELSWLESLIESGFSDVYRTRNPEGRSYTWWSNRLNKRAENRGWRLDYFLVSDELVGTVKNMEHLVDICGSDHCPIMLEV